MIDRPLIRRYVAAIHALAEEADDVERVREQLARLQAAATAAPRLLSILRHPEIAQTDKRELLARLAGDEPSELILGLIDVLLQKGRPEVLEGAADAFTELADEAAGVLRARVEVAWQPDEQQQHRLQTALSHLLGAPVVTEFDLVPEVIGGARAHVAGRLIDGSLAGDLARLLEQIRAAQPA